jgi:two-component system, NtrC family, response regulator AtoC
VARALALNPGGTILPEDLPETVRERWQSQRGAPSRPLSSIAPLPPVMAPDLLIADHPTLEELNRRYAERILKEQGGNKTRAAEVLGIDRKTLSRLLSEE